MEEPHREPAAVSVAALQRIGERLALASGSSLPSSWPQDPAAALGVIESLVEQCAKQIARQRARNEVRKQVEEELRTVERMKTEFIQNISHELRTPLASIEGFSMALLRGLQARESGQDEMPIETRKQFLEIMCREARRLGELIEDVLDITELEAHPLNANPAAFEAREVFHEAVLNLKMKYGEDKAAPVRLELHPEPGGPSLFANREAVREILRHLLDNAHKFSGGQEVVLGAEAAPSEKLPPAGPEVAMTRLWIRDRGAGISRTEHPRLFGKFQRLETATHTLPGTGLGLSIVQTLARQNRGRISLQSEVGRGTTFSIFLPGEPYTLVDPNVSGARPTGM